MTPVAECELCSIADILVERCDPCFGALPGGEVALEIIGAEWPVVEAQEYP